ncbi:hypothetical protein STIAU_2393, partial [Stigmatella aurantiaca DW4/3-1]
REELGERAHPIDDGEHPHFMRREAQIAGGHHAHGLHDGQVQGGLEPPLEIRRRDAAHLIAQDRPSVAQRHGLRGGQLLGRIGEGSGLRAQPLVKDGEGALGELGEGRCRLEQSQAEEGDEQIASEAGAGGLGLLNLFGGQEPGLDEHRAQRILGVRGVHELGIALAEVDLQGAVGEAECEQPREPSGRDPAIEGNGGQLLQGALGGRRLGHGHRRQGDRAHRGNARAGGGRGLGAGRGGLGPRRWTRGGLCRGGQDRGARGPCGLWPRTGGRGSGGSRGRSRRGYHVSPQLPGKSIPDVGEASREGEVKSVLRDLQPSLDGAVVDEQLDRRQGQGAPDHALVVADEVLPDFSLRHARSRSLRENTLQPSPGCAKQAGGAWVRAWPPPARPTPRATNRWSRPRACWVGRSSTPGCRRPCRFPWGSKHMRTGRRPSRTNSHRWRSPRCCGTAGRAGSGRRRTWPRGRDQSR